jgi:hypothetical protein
MTNATNWEKVE